MVLFLIPIYWLLAIGLIFTLEPAIEASPFAIGVLMALGGFSVAFFLSAETFLWWQQGLSFGAHFKKEWRAGLVRGLAGVLAGIVFGVCGLILGTIQGLGMPSIGIIGIIGLCAGSGFIWVQTHRYIQRVSYGKTTGRK